MIARAGQIIRNGGLVAFPTETVYGLGGNALDSSASRKIYAAKGRPSDNPLIVHIADMADLYKIAETVPEGAVRLAERFWPGPLTMIFPKKEIVPSETTGGLQSVAVRFPSDRTAQALILASGGFIAAPSANLSGRPSPTEGAHVIQDLSGRIDMILDGGPCGIGLESTIVDFTEDRPAILRPGFISLPMLQEILQDVRVDPGLLPEEKDAHPKAPGMKYRHYAPKAEMLIVTGTPEEVVAEIRRRVRQDIQNGVSAGIISSDETRDNYPEGIVECAGSLQNDEEIARSLYRILRSFDDRGVGKIYSEAFDTPRLGQAIMNRLLKAAGHQVVPGKEKKDI